MAGARSRGRAKARDLDALLRQAVADSDGLFRQALAEGDIHGLALAGLALDYQGPIAAARFRLVLEKYGGDPLVASAVLRFAESGSDLDAELVKLTFEVIREKCEELGLSRGQADRLAELVRNNSLDAGRRLIALDWLFAHDEAAAIEAARGIAEDEAQPFDQVDKRALALLGQAATGAENGAVLDYAERQLKADQQAQVLEALGAIRTLVSTRDVERVGKILLEAAKKAWPLPPTVSLTRRLTIDQIREISATLIAGGQGAWLNSHFLTSAFKLHGPLLIPLLKSEKTPPEVRRFLASSDWSQHDDKLYDAVARALSHSDDSEALQAARQAIATRCQQTQPRGHVASSQMPRLGARVLLGQALRDEIKCGDPHLKTALGSLAEEDRLAEYQAARWRQPQRAATIGFLVAAMDLEKADRVLAAAHEELSDKAVRAYIQEMPSSLDESMAKKLVAIVRDEPAQLEAVLESVDAAGPVVLGLWNDEDDLTAFDALEGTELHAEAIQHVPQVVTQYSPDLSEADRKRLIEAMPATTDRAGLLLTVLRDRTNPPRRRPSAADLINCMDLLLVHIKEGLIDAGDALIVLTEICREDLNARLRSAAYEALAETEPSQDLVELLLERREGESPSVKKAVEKALNKTGRKIESAASDQHNRARLEAVQLLGRVDGPGAARHARDLLTHPDSRARVVAVETLGAHGEPSDVGLLQDALAEEPSPEVQQARNRAVRRLKVGNTVAAHELLGELLGVGDRRAWDELDPKVVYGDWGESIVLGLDRVVQAESDGSFGTAIDQLNEVAKALLYRAIGVAGEEAKLKTAYRERVAGNAENYGTVVRNPQLHNHWRWVSHLGALYELRTEHIAKRGSTTPPPIHGPEDLLVAKRLFRLGGLPCLEKIVAAATIQE